MTICLALFRATFLGNLLINASFASAALGSSELFLAVDISPASLGFGFNQSFGQGNSNGRANMVGICATFHKGVVVAEDILIHGNV